MITLAWYLLKVLICSGILCGYYFFALRNKAFHRWNRFYLLASVVISFLVPIIKFDIFQNEDSKGTVVQVLQTISYGDEAVIEYSKNNSFQLSSQNLAEGAYLLISLILLSIFLISLYKIIKLRRKYPETKIENISFINTDARGTPFSFFKSIFWNKAINLHTKAGQQIFNHELAHIQEKHSYDKIFMSLVLIFFWINPFFWLMRKELYMIHEFIADKEALEDNDLNAFAEMVLQTVYPGQNFSFTNNFFYSPLKRRILMLTKNKNPKVSYLSRLLVLPLAAIIFFAFTLKVKSNQPASIYNGNTITVIIDAGHGGRDLGAKGGNADEKDITLAIAKKVKELNSNKKINIVLSRDNDDFISVHDRASFANKTKADLFISIHLQAILSGNNLQKSTRSGFSVIIAKNDNAYSSQSKLLGFSIINSFKDNYPLPVASDLMQRERGIWVLKATECPAVVIEAGYITTPKDLEYLSQSKNQETIAKNILNGIENYEYSLKNAVNENANVNDNILPNRKDSIPFPMYYKGKKVKNISVQSNSKNIKVTESVIKVSYEDGSTEMISKEESDKRGFILPPPPPQGLPPYYFKTNMLFVVDGKITPKEKVKSMDPKRLGTIYILKKDEAIKKYGDKGKNGVIEINLKNSTDETTTIIADSFFIKGNGNLTGNRLIFINGKESTEEELRSIPPGDIGSVTLLKGGSAELLYGEKAKDGVMKITTKQGRGKVTPVSTIYGSGSYNQNDTVPDKVFKKVEVEASFPGGTDAWAKYIQRAIQDSIPVLDNEDYGTCVVRFIVNTNGNVSNVEATTMKGTHLANIAVNAIKKGPKWIPASQNGHTVAAYRLQPVTLINPDGSEKNSSKTQQQPNEGKLLTKIEHPASFPGGQASWLKYLSRIFEKNSSKLMGDKNNLGTCKVKFIVTKDGNVSNVEAITRQGTQLAELAVDAIRKGPKWVPGRQNGQRVNSYVIQPVTFVLNDKLTVNEPK
ncbi:MAG: N-acetylmuramoyl-L-alanine amidase [Ginsengibacter sp.]